MVIAGLFFSLCAFQASAQDLRQTPSDNRAAVEGKVYDDSLERREEYEWSMFWHAHAADTTLPRVLLIGDSITNQYHNSVDSSLVGIANVSRLATSKPLGSPMLLKEIEMMMAEYDFDVVHFNNGLHGWRYSEEEYAAALPQMYELIHRMAPDAKLIWATCTAIHEGEGMKSFDKRTSRVIERNRLAKAFFYDKPVKIDDLYEIVSLDPANYEGGDGCHLNPLGVKRAAEQVSSMIKQLLP